MLQIILGHHLNRWNWIIIFLYFLRILFIHGLFKKFNHLLNQLSAVPLLELDRKLFKIKSVNCETYNLMIMIVFWEFPQVTWTDRCLIKNTINFTNSVVCWSSHSIQLNGGSSPATTACNILSIRHIIYYTRFILIRHARDQN